MEIFYLIYFGFFLFLQVSMLLKFFIRTSQCESYCKNSYYRVQILARSTKPIYQLYSSKQSQIMIPLFNLDLGQYIMVSEIKLSRNIILVILRPTY